MENVTFVIFGATGDLTKRKLIPAIYRLVKNSKLKKFVVVGIARLDIKMSEVISEAKKFSGRVDEKAWKKLKSASYYHQLNFYDEKGYFKLRKFLDETEKKYKLKGNRIFYLATLPEHFDVITHSLANSGIARKTRKNFPRVVYEKPFGDDLKSAKKINKCINRIFNEKQIYRIDHYLGKELVRNIALIRFTNLILEPLWNKKYIKSVQIILNENFGVEGRASFYDKYGALKDVVQNHALQLLALTAMESPRLLTGKYLCDEKVKVLKKIAVKDVLLGQYEGYKKEKGVKNDSTTETFAALHLEISNKRWRGVPFYVKAGKYLYEKKTGIYLNFKKVNCLLAKACPSDTNYFAIRIQPDEGFELSLNSKIQSKDFEVKPVRMDFCHSCLYGFNTPKSYEILIEDVIKGEQSVFVRNDEIESAWKIIDKIKKDKYRIYPYKKGSDGPSKLKEWSLKHKMRWMS